MRRELGRRKAEEEHEGPFYRLRKVRESRGEVDLRRPRPVTEGADVGVEWGLTGADFGESGDLVEGVEGRALSSSGRRSGGFGGEWRGGSRHGDLDGEARGRR